MIEPAIIGHLEVDAGEGLRLHLARAGTGPPVVMLHGFTGSTTTWAALTAALGIRYTSIAVDLPGHGRSTAPDIPARYGLDRFAADLARMLDSLGIERAAVLGYSMGGRAALRFSLRYPARVRALILESTSAGLTDEADRAARVASDQAIADMVERDGIHAFVDFWERLPIWKSQMLLSPADRSELRAQRLAGDARGLANSLRGAGAGLDSSVTDMLAEHDVPTLVIAGELDEKYVRASRILAASMLKARVAIVPSAGHAVHLEQPEAFAKLVLAFLREAPSDANVWR